MIIKFMFGRLALVILYGVGNLANPVNISFSETATQPESLTTHATIEAIGVIAPYQGDDNQNSSATIWYRISGESSWQIGPEMTVDRDAREWRVSIVYCLPGTMYEIEVRYADPDGVKPVTMRTSISTRPDYPNVGNGSKIWYVPDDGDLQAVIEAASAGETVRIRSGTYYTNAVLTVANSGVPGNYLTIEAALGDQVVLDGSDPNLNDISVNNWLHYQDSIYYADLPWGDIWCDEGSMPNYVGEQNIGDGRRYILYKGASVWGDFLAAPPGKAYYDCNGHLYVVTYNMEDPDNLEMHVSQRATGIVLEGADYVRIRNIEFRYYGLTGISLASPCADNNVIEGNTFHGIGLSHIKIGKWGTPCGSNNLIQDNHIYETGYRDSGWTWRAAHDQASTEGVLLSYAGSGNVIRRNTLVGTYDGIDVRRQSHNTDIYANVIQNCMDDGIEVDEQPGYNIRVWGNKISYCYSGISNQDWFTGDYWNTGPVYIFRNIIEGGDDPQGRTDYKGGTEGYVSNYAFKVGTDQDWPARVYYYHNTISIPDSSVGGSGIQDAGGEHFSGLVSRNNLWNVTRRVYNLRRTTTTVQNDMDCNNLHNPGTSEDTRFILWSQTGGPESNGVYRNLADFQTFTGQDLKSISNDSTLFNPDLSLRAGSPEIDAGCVIVGFNDRGPFAYLGEKPDIGAFEYVPAPDLSASVKTASQRVVSTGDIVTYTVNIINTGIPLTSTLVMTDVLPIGLEYLPGSVTATLGTISADADNGSTAIHWQGIMGDTSEVEIRYAVQVDIIETSVLKNTARITDHGAHFIDRSTHILINGYTFHFPIILHNSQLILKRIGGMISNSHLCSANRYSSLVYWRSLVCSFYRI